MVFNRRFLLRTLTALLPAAGIACGGGEDSCNSPTEPLIVASVEVAPGSGEVLVGRTLQMQAMPRTACGNLVPDANIIWSSAAQSIASVSPTGLVTGNAPGTVTIAALAEGKVGTSQVTVNGVPVATVTVTPPEATLQVGGTILLEATLRDEDGNVLNGPIVTWLSADTARVQVSSAGQVTARRIGGPVTITAASGGKSGSSAITVETGPAQQLLFSRQPSDGVAGEVLSPAVELTVVDQNGDKVTTENGPVGIAIADNPGGATLGGTTTVALNNGVASFSDLTLNRTGTGYTLAATYAALPTATSAGFTIIAGPTAALAWEVQPGAAKAGQPITPAIQVSLRDALGNLVEGDDRNVTLDLESGPTGAHLLGLTTAPAVDGIAVFSGVALDSIGSYTLRATASGLPVIISNAFEVGVGPPGALTFVTQPSETPASEPITPAPQVRVTDAFGHVVVDPAVVITIALGNNPSGASLSGDKTRTTDEGIATFTGLELNRAGSGYTLVATLGNVPPATSAAFDITSRTAVALLVETQPSDVAAGQPIAPSVRVSVRDDLGNILETDSRDITVAINTGVAGAAFGGTKTVAAVDGVATFSNLTLDKVGEYTLKATSSGGLPPVTTNAFDVRAGAAAKLVFLVQPTNTEALFPIIPAPQVRVTDAFDNPVLQDGIEVTMQIGANPGGGSLVGDTDDGTNDSGVAVFPGLSITKKGSDYTLIATSPGLTQKESRKFKIQ